MSNTTYTAQAFQPAATENLWVSMFKATPLYIFASAVKAALTSANAR
jgi:hypothetical protein